MSLRKRVAELDLVIPLLCVVVVEMALNRLAVPALRPPGDGAPPAWHRYLDLAALFAFYFATVLALAAAAWKARDVLVAKGALTRQGSLLVVAATAPFLALAAGAIFHREPQAMSFYLETSFVTLALVSCAALAMSPADRMVKLGLVVACVPLVLHYYGTFSLRFLMQLDAARGSSLPEEIRRGGQWSIALVAIAVAPLFGPRPFQQALRRTGPMVIAACTGAIAALIMRRHYEVGMELAARSFGIELGPGGQSDLVAAYVVAAAALVWTLAVTLSSAAPARRLIGVGLALLACGGYAFAWPLHYLVAAAGILAIVDGGARAAAEEASLSCSPSASFAATAWQALVDALAEAVGAGEVRVLPGDDREITELRGHREGLPFVLALTRATGRIRMVTAHFGEGAGDGVEPSWTLVSRRDGPLAAAHPPPPPTRARVVKTGDRAFERRFRLRDGSGRLTALLDDGLRARAAALLDGWIAAWPGRCVDYCVYPGRGVPLDYPVPQEARSDDLQAIARSTEQLARVFDLLAELAARGLEADAGRR